MQKRLMGGGRGSTRRELIQLKYSTSESQVRIQGGGVVLLPLPGHAGVGALPPLGFIGKG